MFLQTSVILSTGGGCLPQCMLGYHPLEQTPPCADTPPPRDQTPPPRSRHPPGADTPRTRHPPGTRHPLGPDMPREHIPKVAHTPPHEHTPPLENTPPWSSPPPGSRLRHMVSQRPVRILLECILVQHMFPLTQIQIQIPFPNGYCTHFREGSQSQGQISITITYISIRGLESKS